MMDPQNNLSNGISMEEEVELPFKWITNELFKVKNNIGIL
jgi:hypothetical protein